MEPAPYKSLDGSALSPFRPQLPASDPKKSKPWVLVLAILALSLIGLALFLAFKEPIIAFLENLATFIASRGVGGGLLITFMIVLASFPPVFGYSTLLYLSGYIYGFPLGFLPGFFGAIIGASLCFLASRRFFKDYVVNVLSGYPQFSLISKVIERRGFKLLVFIRLAPYPFNIFNVLLSTTLITFRDFILATALSLVKIAIHIYIGSQLHSLTDMISGKHRSNPLSIAFLVVGGFIAIGLLVWFWIVVKREIKLMEEEVELGIVWDGEDDGNIIIGKWDENDQD